MIDSDELGEPTIQAILRPCGVLCPETKLFFVRLVYFYGSEYFNGATRGLAQRFGLTDLLINRAVRELMIAGLLARRKVKSGGKGRPRVEYRITDLFFSQVEPEGYAVSRGFRKILSLLIGVYHCRLDRYPAVIFQLAIKKIIFQKVNFKFIKKKRYMDLIPIDYSVVFEDRWAGAFHYFKIASEMKSSMRLLLAVLVACADRAGVVQGVTIKQLMDLTGMTKKRLLQHLAKLVRQVYLRRFIPDYVGVYSPFKDRTGMYQLNLCHADFSHVGTSQTALVALLPMELAVSADLDAAVFDALDDCSKQYVSRVLQLHVPAHHADNIHFLSNASPVDFRICSFKKYIAKQAQSPAALRLFGQLNEDLVQFLMFKLDQIAFDLMRQLSSGYWVWLTYVEFCNKHPEWTQRFSKDDMDLGELIWGLTQLKAWRYEQLIKFSYSESIFICTPSGFEPPEKYRMGVLTTHTRSRSSNLDARFTVRFQELPPNRTWRTLSDPKQVEQVKRDYGFVTKFGLNDEERARLYSSFMDG